MTTLYKLSPKGKPVEATDAEILSVAGTIRFKRRTVNRGAKSWKRHSTKAGSRCRCPECSARRARETFLAEERRRQVVRPSPIPRQSPQQPLSIRSSFLSRP